MKEVFTLLYPTALRAGLGPLEFWELTFHEISTAITAFNEQLEYEMRQQAASNYILADLIGASVARLMDSKAKYPKIHEVYPSLFEAETEQPQQDWLLAKERMLDFAQARNSLIRKEVNE